MAVKKPLVLTTGGVEQLQTGDSVALSNLTATRVPFAAASGELVDSANLTFNGSSISTLGANLGWSLVAPNLTGVISGFCFPRTGDLGNITFWDFWDEFAFIDQKGAVLTYSATPVGGTYNNAVPFRDDSRCIAYASGTSPSPVVVEIDCTANPITAKGNGYYNVGFVIRSVAAAGPSYVKIELWNGTAYATVFDSAVTVSTTNWTWWVSPRLLSPHANYGIHKLKISLTVPTPLASDFNIQRIILYHQSAAINEWQIHRGGSAMYGSLTLAASANAIGALPVAVPLKFLSSTVLTTPLAGAIEFTTDNLYATITTGPARKGIVLNDGANLTSGKIPVASTNGRLIDGPTPLAGTKIYYVSDTDGGAVNRKLTFSSGILIGEV